MADKNRFASETLVGVQEVATGITGVRAFKSGNIVTLVLIIPTTTNSTSGWYQLGTLPQELRPSMNLRFSGYDNAPDTYANSSAVLFNITTNRELKVYFFKDKLSMQPHATVTYITD